MSIEEINRQLSIISRVVIHPKYRTIGLGAKLIRETLPLVGTPYVEMIAVMAKYSPFAEKAGMQKITQLQSANSMSEVSNTLSGLGFDLHLLGSEHYVRQKLESSDSQQMRTLKVAFAKNKHLRFRQELASGQPFGKASDYLKNIRNADSSKIAKLIKIFGMLLQTKVYLFWRSNGTSGTN
jgi:hypothetical protein